MLQSRLLTDLFISIPNTKPFQYILFNSLPVPTSMVGSSRFHRSSEVKVKLFHIKISKAIFTGQLLQTKEQNRVIFQRQCGVYIIDRNAASLTLKCRFRINSKSLQQLLKYQHWRPSRNLTTELGIKDHVTNMWHMTLMWMVHAVIINEMWQ